MSFTIDSGAISGFIAAQDAMRAQLGATASFYVPTAPSWPDGTAINPDTGEPFDSTAVQVNQPFEATEIVVLVIEKEGSPLRPQADQNFTPSGAREGADIILDVSATDYATIEDATRFEVMGGNYDLEEAKAFTLANTIYRYLVYGAQR